MAWWVISPAMAACNPPYFCELYANNSYSHLSGYMSGSSSSTVPYWKLIHTSP